MVASIDSVVTGFQRATVNGPSFTITGVIRPADTVRRASSATRANHASESDRNSDPGSSDNQTAVPIASSCTDDACSAGRPSMSRLMRPIAPYDTGVSCQPVRRPVGVEVAEPAVEPRHRRGVDAVPSPDVQRAAPPRPLRHVRRPVTRQRGHPPDATDGLCTVSQGSTSVRSTGSAPRQQTADGRSTVHLGQTPDVTPAPENDRSASAIAARAYSEVTIASTAGTAVWVWPGHCRCCTGTPASASAAA